MNHTACEKDKAVIIHSLPVTAEISSSILTGFIQPSLVFFTKKYIFLPTSLNREIGWAMFHKMPNYISLNICSERNECHKRNVKQRVIKLMQMGMINVTQCMWHRCCVSQNENKSLGFAQWLF